MNLNFNLTLTKSQQEAMDLINNPKYKFFVFLWSRQCGKSTLMSILCIIWLFRQKERIAYVCPSYKLAKTIYKELIQAIPPQHIKKANSSDLTIEVGTSILTFYSAESGNSARGIANTRLIVDEAAFLDYEMPDGTDYWYSVLQPTTKAKCKTVIFVSTPKNKNRFYEFYQRGLDTAHPKWVSMKKTIWDDELTTKETIEEYRKSMPKRNFEQEYECIFQDDSGSFFSNFTPCFNCKTFDTKVPCYIGVDLSAGGTDRTVVTFLNHNNQAKQKFIDGSLDKKYYEIGKIINETPNLRQVYVEGNGIGNVMLNEILKYTTKKHLVKEWITTQQTKINQGSALQVLFDQQTISIDETNDELKKELSNFGFSVSKNGKMTLAAIGGLHDDAVLSLMIALQCKMDMTKMGQYLLRF